MNCVVRLQDVVWTACCKRLFGSGRRYAALRSECPTRLRSFLGVQSVKQVYQVLRTLV